MDSNRIQIGNTIYSRAADGYLTPIATIPAPTPKATTPDGKKGMLDYYLGGTGIPERLRAVNNIFNPVEAVGQSMDASRRMFAPGATGWERTQAAGDMLSGVASVLPLGKVVGATDDLARGAMKVEDAARDFAVDEFGGVGLSDPIATRGTQIMDMLRSGRGADVTDEMLDMGDATANARLNEWLFNNYDLPMDAASRAARAGDMGFDGNLYHGTGADFPAFYDARRGNFFTDRPEIADIYASGSTGGSASIRGQASNAGANYIPVKLRGPDLTVTDKGPDGSHGWLTDNIAASVSGVEKFPLGTYPRRLNDAARSQGYGAIRIDDMLDLGGEQTQWMSIDPSGIRSRFARFDPRLAHLRNLSASGLLPFAAFFGLDKEQQ